MGRRGNCGVSWDPCRGKGIVHKGSLDLFDAFLGLKLHPFYAFRLLNKAEPFWLFQASEIVKICPFQGPQWIKIQLFQEPECFKKVQFQEEIFKFCLILESKVKHFFIAVILLILQKKCFSTKFMSWLCVNYYKIKKKKKSEQVYTHIKEFNWWVNKFKSKTRINIITWFFVI
jgi:hypothetical protein